MVEHVIEDEHLKKTLQRAACGGTSSSQASTAKQSLIGSERGHGLVASHVDLADLHVHDCTALDSHADGQATKRHGLEEHGVEGEYVQYAETPVNEAGRASAKRQPTCGYTATDSAIDVDGVARSHGAYAYAGRTPMSLGPKWMAGV